MKQLPLLKGELKKTFLKEELNLQQMLKIRGGDGEGDGGQPGPGEPWPK